jgi:SulP family sulfate permease
VEGGDQIPGRYHRVEVIGFNRASADIIDRYALHDRAARQVASASLH